ncbi:hypothetical protein [Streptomyces sp. NBC_01602]|uniref:hypothetical protein n=1 Tax=Streptomyces sp. NBC_01602 TaxID=2975893 RepID=UPI003870D981|nr:hypothetical protein OG955_00385 [Streptomyces sp. NBC_01602]
MAAASAAIAVYAAYWARRTARGTFTHTAYELARTLHTDLTTGTTAHARDVLEHFRSGTRYHQPGPDGLPPTAGTQEVLEAYFALLWCFERILIGRRTLSEQQNWNDTGPAVAFLDNLLTWHLKRWAERWPTIRTALKAPGKVPDLRDHDSLNSFCDLVEEVTGPNEHTAQLRTLIQEEEDQGTGTT